MAGGVPSAPLRTLDEDAALRAILEGTATETGERFFAALVERLSEVLGTHGAWVTEYLEDARRLRALAFRMGGRWIRDFEYDVAGTPCEVVVGGRRLVHHERNVIDLYPEDADLKEFGAVSFMGLPLVDEEQRVLGHLAVLDTRPMPADPTCLTLFRIFAARAAAELRRLRAEAAVRERERKLSQLVGNALDAIVELDRDLVVTMVNPAAERLLDAPAERIVGAPVGRFLAPASQERLARLAEELRAARDGAPAGSWVAGGLEARTPGGEPRPAEATLSRFAVDGRPFYTLILRDLRAREAAEARIRSLSEETAWLRGELARLQESQEILGTSPALRAVLQDVQQVGPTDASVLLCGETGTGKELIARAIHAASARREGPLVTVNCAAIPSELIESEFFGHERGAFTGATAKREGRFALAHGGTIFLDEIGELPLALQPKLLRVLQAGTFEPVGSSRTRRVDVRVVAATNRDLAAASRAGSFREDLYYRLSVFPIAIPPLRERTGDVALLANAFAAQAAVRLGRRLQPLDAEDLRRLEAYPWPGNVRELQNVIERAVITAREGRLDLRRALPPVEGAPAPGDDPRDRGAILTAEELVDLERENIRRALAAAGGKVAGADGAAARLGMRPSTLSSRMKALGITRPRD